MNESILKSVRDLLRTGQKLEAIFVYRRGVGCSLAEALDAVNNIDDGLDPKTPRPRSPLIGRWYRLVGPRRGQPIRQFVGFPIRRKPLELGGIEMGWPRVLILIEHGDNSMLYRYTAEGEFAGDTWAKTADGARDQADFEYTDSVEGDWIPIPDGVVSGQELEWALRKPS